MAVPNQKLVSIGSRLPRDNEHPFSEQSVEAMSRAARALQGDRFKVWLYLSKNRDDFKLELSQKAIENEMGVKKDTYHRAITDMIELGYLVPVSGNEYRFEEWPVDGDTPKNPWDF